MNKTANIPKFILLTALAMILSIVTVVMGAPILRVLRKAYGPLVYWIVGLMMVSLLWLIQAQELAVYIASVWMTLGAYVELEHKGLGWWKSGLASLALGTTAAMLGASSVFRLRGLEPITELQKFAEKFVGNLKQVNPQMEIDAMTLVQQIPSAIVVVLAVTLGFGLIFESRAFALSNLPRVKVATQLKLLEYRVPEFFIWIAMTAFLLTMVSFGGRFTTILALNVMNVSVVLYFFQGLAVTETFLNTVRAGFFTRFLTYLLFVGQLFAVVSAIGLIDYWVDFRKRFQKWKLNLPE